ncbi:MAG TPA: citrate synthase [Caldilineae bacterium]|nr:citrate synthase [Caldilineae bacterium]
MSNTSNTTGSTDNMAKGLEDVVITTTKLSKVDGIAGHLYYRGYSIDVLAQHASFEEVAHLLWFGHLPNKAELQATRERLARERYLTPGLVDSLRNIPSTASPMAVLRSAVSLLGHYDPEAEDTNHEAVMDKACRLTAQIASVIAAFERLRRGQELVEPREDLNHAANFLYMLTGEEPDPAASRALEMYLILLADHEFNASTFAARVTASTMSDLYSAVTAAIGALKGPLHGAANQKAMEQFMEIGSVENVRSWFEKAKAERRRIMGVGHRVYKVLDPRARHLREVALQLNEVAEDHRWLDIALKLEELVESDPYFNERQLHPNVDYYSAPLLYTLGIPVDLFTTIFAMSRIVGWTAHVMEQWADNRLIRPRAQYVGPIDLPWVPLEQRG